MINAYRFIYTVLLICAGNEIFAQRDTSFWFVVPEIARGNFDYDRPGVFKISAYEEAATVTISMPANASFPTQSIMLSPGGSTVVDITPYIDLVENKPPNTVLNKGILIQSSSFVTVYYETVGALITNPEIYALKGKNALGTNFYIPFQTLMDNSDAHFPTPHAAFDIVATENNTQINITPTKALAGHPANITYSISLNKGQTYSAEAASQAANQHPSGSRVTSDKPIAITIKDDLVVAAPLFPGFCRDQIGDQLIPVEKVGQKYIAQKGTLNNNEYVIIVGTQNNTQIQQDGNTVGTIGAGVSLPLSITSGAHFIEASAPFYTLQISGIGCELAGEILPPIECGGSEEVSFIRTSSGTFQLFVVTETANIGNFILNGSPTLLSPALFSPVPGTGGQYMATSQYYSTGEIPVGISTLVKNTSGRFHLGLINGEETQGANFGFFSDFLNKTVVRDTIMFCQGDTVQVHGLNIDHVGDYAVFSENVTGCDTLYEIHAAAIPVIEESIPLWTCPNSPFEYEGNLYFPPAAWTDSIPGIEGCDTIRTFVLFTQPLSTLSRQFSFCPGDTLWINGMGFSVPATFIDTLPGGANCDTVRTTLVRWSELPEYEQTIWVCPGEKAYINGLSYSPGALVRDTLRYPETCDTVRIWLVKSYPQQMSDFLPDTAIYCPGDLLQWCSPWTDTQWNGATVGICYQASEAGTVIAAALDVNGCPVRDTVVVSYCCGPSTIYAPNSFAPGQAPPNHHFTVFTKAECDTYLLRIYDRWGALLFESHGSARTWDGTFRGKDCAPGVYIWVLETGQKEQPLPSVIKGSVTLLR